MLHHIPALLSPELLKTLAEMGHGDEIVVGDANFPAHALGQRVHRMDGISATEAAKAILHLLPLDSFVEANAHVMQVVGDATASPPIFAEFQALVDAADNPAPIARLERFAFYERARKAFAVVQTGEFRLYGNLILTKGVIGAAP
ncbi:RbsD/FucU family protein [Ponticoccus alexandrii]|uniref:Ribose ABC transporter n=1 Tax=Ponticoccus alexandrii TaxID=1943633 RepID=A0ABX7F6X2_9RHOB|nr:RbsD/FucU domain-containing protein [Ponticoccus alexandrii]ETA51732.1 ribose ABC transporter [Rhodobacteraceae bacterium PD-2]QRF65334.1 ribose ABC transporter [Ponticoccus alexandrii]